MAWPGTPRSSSSSSTRSDTFPEPTLRTLYVSPTGSNSNPGTDPGRPAGDHPARGRSLPTRRPHQHRSPGSTANRSTFPPRGRPRSPSFSAARQPGAVLDGADETILAGVTWTADGNGVYSRILGFSTGHVVTDQGRLFRYDNLSDLGSLGAGAPGGFYLRRNHALRQERRWQLAGSQADARGPPRGRLLPQRPRARPHREPRNPPLRIRDYGKGVYLRYSSDCAVRMSRIHEIGSAGVWIKGGERNTVEDNEFWDTSIFDWPWPFTKGSSAENNAVVLTDNPGRGNVIRRNTIRGFFNGMGPCGSSPPPTGFTTETDVYDNVFSEHTDDAIEPEGYCANVRIWGNHIEDVHMAFAVAPAAPGPTWILRNVAYNFGNTRTSQSDGYTASALKINSGYSTPIGPLFLYHNTFLTEAPGHRRPRPAQPRREHLHHRAKQRLRRDAVRALQGQPRHPRLRLGRPLTPPIPPASSNGRAPTTPISPRCRSPKARR